MSGRPQPAQLVQRRHRRPAKSADGRRSGTPAEYPSRSAVVSPSREDPTPLGDARLTGRAEGGQPTREMGSQRRVQIGISAMPAYSGSSWPPGGEPCPINSRPGISGIARKCRTATNWPRSQLASRWPGPSDPDNPPPGRRLRTLDWRNERRDYGPRGKGRSA
jgi:hypothetical protein